MSQITAEQLRLAIRRQGDPETGLKYPKYPVAKILVAITQHDPHANIASFRQSFRKSEHRKDKARELVHCMALHGLRIAEFDPSDPYANLESTCLDLKMLREYLDEHKYPRPRILFDADSRAVFWFKGEVELVERRNSIISQLKDLDSAEHQVGFVVDPLERAKNMAFIEHRRAELQSEDSGIDARLQFMRETRDKLRRQTDVILETIKSRGYSPEAVPLSGKAAVKEQCLLNPKLFTKSSFDRAWNEGSKIGLWAIEGKERFRPDASP